jgi:glycosyltransferase involved in cell wall biosynthesis
MLRDAPIQFVFIGNGAKRQNCMDTLTDLCIQNCLFLPYQDRQVLPYSLTACDLNLISIDRGMEGLVAPSKLYSSLASGRPIAAICPPHSYLRDIVVTSHCGIAIDNGDARGLANFILKLSQDAMLGKQMGENGRKYMIENFTPECIADLYLQIILDCVDLSSKRSIPRETSSPCEHPLKLQSIRKSR